MKLSNVADIRGILSTKVKEYYCNSGEGISWPGPKDLSVYHWKFIKNRAREITDFGFRKPSTKLMRKGMVVISSRISIGYIAISEDKICTNQDFK